MLSNLIVVPSTVKEKLPFQMLIWSELIQIHSNQCLPLVGICTTAAPTLKLPSRVLRSCVVSPTTPTFRIDWWEISHTTRYISLNQQFFSERQGYLKKKIIIIKMQQSSEKKKDLNFSLKHSLNIKPWTLHLVLFIQSGMVHDTKVYYDANIKKCKL